MPSPTISDLFRRQEMVYVDAATIRADIANNSIVSEFAPPPIAGMAAEDTKNGQNGENTNLDPDTTFWCNRRSGSR